MITKEFVRELNNQIGILMYVNGLDSDVTVYMDKDAYDQLFDGVRKMQSDFDHTYDPHLISKDARELSFVSSNGTCLIKPYLAKTDSFVIVPKESNAPVGKLSEAITELYSKITDPNHESKTVQPQVSVGEKKDQ